MLVCGVLNPLEFRLASDTRRLRSFFDETVMGQFFSLTLVLEVLGSHSVRFLDKLVIHVAFLTLRLGIIVLTVGDRVDRSAINPVQVREWST